ncbi:MAG: DNA-processing protein DprA [Prevotella sp.]|nr:DNA-processing protein DprA [Prevotella sp.]
MNEQEIYYTMALTRLTGVSHSMTLQLYREQGSGQAVYEQYQNRFHWDEALRRAAAEMEFCTKNNIRVLTLNDADFPRRLSECPDAPITLYYKGTADLNQQRVIDIVGTRQCTTYGQDIIRRFVSDLRKQCPDVLIVSGLAYGVDIHAHRHALQNGYETVGVLAHGLDQIYPHHHRDTAAVMVEQGGLLTEYMTQTQALPNNFRQRNRIVAGMSDATILVESAYKGGGLITCRIAQEYGRDVFAFPGAVGMPYSEGCNKMIRDNTAALITSVQDFVEAMGWGQRPPQSPAVEGELFTDLTVEEQRVMTLLQKTNDLQQNMLSVQTDIPIGQLTALLFQLEMKGAVRIMAGGMVHLLS